MEAYDECRERTTKRDARAHSLSRRPASDTDELAIGVVGSSVRRFASCTRARERKRSSLERRRVVCSGGQMCARVFLLARAFFVAAVAFSCLINLMKPQMRATAKRSRRLLSSPLSVLFHQKRRLLLLAAVNAAAGAAAAAAAAATAAAV